MCHNNRMEPTDYLPIDCNLYSEYECAIVQHQRLQLAWRDDEGMVHLEIITPLDLQTRSREEYLLVSDARQLVREIRLDRILRHAVIRD